MWRFLDDMLMLLSVPTLLVLSFAQEVHIKKSPFPSLVPKGAHAKHFMTVLCAEREVPLRWVT